MTTISSKTFLENPNHFFNLARREDVAVKRGKSMFRIVFNETSESISPAKLHQEIKDAVDTVNLVKRGKISARSAKDLLNEL